MPSPEQFTGVTAIAKANVYFDGKVVSHTILLPGGAKKTLGLIYPGSYHFGTAAPERMEIIAGACRVTLDGAAGARDFATGTSVRRLVPRPRQQRLHDRGAGGHLRIRLLVPLSPGRLCHWQPRGGLLTRRLPP